jgi:hypothetical protein
VFGDGKTWALLWFRGWNVFDPFTPENSDGGGKAVTEQFALTVADNDQYVGSGLFQLRWQFVERLLASPKALPPYFQSRLVCKTLRLACSYRKPIPRPPIPTPSHNNIETMAATLPHAGLMCASSDRVMRR